MTERPTVRLCDGCHYRRAWVAWALATAAGFAVIETAALRSGPGQGRTLSAQLRRRRRVSAALIGVGAGWLIHHVGWEGDR